MFLYKKRKPLNKVLNEHILNLPVALNLNYFYNYGSILGGCFAIQVISGFLLSIFFESHVSYAFDRTIKIFSDTYFGSFLRLMHANGASIFFACIYIHIGRGLYYSSYIKKKTWFSGIVIFILRILIAFIGYVLVWGQISYWATTVITNLLRVIPYIGPIVVEWVWGSFSVSSPTFSRFFSLHFILPLLLLVLILRHIILIHEKLTFGPRGLNNYDDIIPFKNYFTSSDSITFFLILFFLMLFLVFYPYVFLDPENFQKCDTIITPEHILPEWYFLPFYAILRRVPNKLLGVIILLIRLLTIFILPFLNINSCRVFQPLIKILFWCFLANFLFLGWIGIKPVEEPYIIIGIISIFIYFLFIFLININYKTL